MMLSKLQLLLLLGSTVAVELRSKKSLRSIAPDDDEFDYAEDDDDDPADYSVGQFLDDSFIQLADDNDNDADYADDRLGGTSYVNADELEEEKVAEAESKAKLKEKDEAEDSAEEEQEEKMHASLVQQGRAALKRKLQRHELGVTDVYALFAKSTGFTKKITEDDDHEQIAEKGDDDEEEFDEAKEEDDGDFSDPEDESFLQTEDKIEDDDEDSYADNRLG